ncbi:hypothetical protein POM88_054451 [Heracleum sosnowskyi]|uniref:Uncharacterized protein n=1 Tax=Heracleum sosnowskyi TaxID=360622 RepID=A0AAD8LX15_9APIA|nr:hypothetical protein POM88_054451 [Heracleum sosnowskyi]
MEQNHEALDKFKARYSNNKVPSRRHTHDVWNHEKVQIIPIDLKEAAEKHPSVKPPIELFNKLSLKSDFGTALYKSKSNQVTKRSKENKPGSIQHDFKRFVGKPNNCESTRRNPEIAYQQNMNRCRKGFMGDTYDNASDGVKVVPRFCIQDLVS